MNFNDTSVLLYAHTRVHTPVAILLFSLQNGLMIRFTEIIFLSLSFNQLNIFQILKAISFRNFKNLTRKIYA